jgi:SAM-dependent methyltransferase
MKSHPILANVAAYYSEKVQTHGTTARGVDWNSTESQELRFAQLLKVCNPAQPFSLLDYGCGYGALAMYLAGLGWDVRYTGFDISEAMIAQARTMLVDSPHCTCISDEALLQPVDYTVASGIFNVRLQQSDDIWQEYVLQTLQQIDQLSIRGFAFNVLTRYSDPGYMRTDLHYADPLFLFDHCKRQFSRSVALLHDYPLYEFTILVRKDH